MKYTLKLIGEATVTQQKTFKTTFKNLHRRCTNNIITETVPSIDTPVSETTNFLNAPRTQLDLYLNQGQKNMLNYQ